MELLDLVLSLCVMIPEVKWGKDHGWEQGADLQFHTQHDLGNASCHICHLVQGDRVYLLIVIVLKFDFIWKSVDKI